MKKKLISALLCTAMVSSMLAGCGSDSSSSTSTNEGTTTTTDEATTDESTTDDSADASTGDGKVYFLNFKPEQDEQWQEMAEAYTNETGVPVTVVTAASDTYESTLKSEMAKTEVPTIFQVNGPVGLATWNEYCADLSDTAFYKDLSSDDFALKGEDGSVQAVAYVIETYGLIYNKTVLNAYCGMDNAVVTSIDEINSLETLKAVAEDIQSRLSEVSAAAGDGYDLKGAFTSAGMDSSSDWRFKTHLANYPIYYEYKADDITSTDAIKGTYLDNYKEVWDMYINNATCEPTLIATKTGDEASSEFALGEAVFYQNGTWAYSDIINGGFLTDDDLGMMPIYFGVDDANEGLATGSENYVCINSKASEADIKASEDFLAWCVESDFGINEIANEMGFVTPFTTFTDDKYNSENVFVTQANEYIANGKSSVTWNFTTIPSEEWKNNVGSALTEYAQGTGDWDAVVSAFVDGWATEYAATH
jgi:raffinose/stachyose/melibiose transport system substrate-binding protein